jgi:hypothetical protein
MFEKHLSTNIRCTHAIAVIALFVLIAVASPSAQAQTFTVLHSFHLPTGRSLPQPPHPRCARKSLWHNPSGRHQLLRRFYLWDCIQDQQCWQANCALQLRRG